MKRPNDSAEFSAIYINMLLDGVAMLAFFAFMALLAGIGSGRI